MKRKSAEELQRDITRSAVDDNLIQNIANSADSFAKMKKIVQSVTKDISSNTQEKQRQEMTRSADFWNTNKNFEDEVDALLQRLKFFDQEVTLPRFFDPFICDLDWQPVGKNLIDL